MKKLAEFVSRLVIVAIVVGIAVTYSLRQAEAPGPNPAPLANEQRGSEILEKYFLGDTIPVGDDFWIREAQAGWDIHSRDYSERMLPFREIFESHLAKCGDDAYWHEYFQSVVIPELFSRYEVSRQKVPKP